MLDGLFDFIGGGVFAIFLVIIVVVLIVSYIGSRYKVAGANEALIVSGQRDKGPDGRKNLKVVRGGGVIVLPLIHKVGKLKLTARQINVNLADAVTRQGIKVAVQGVATFKIGADDESIRNAAERFLEAREEEVDSIVKNVLEGSLRSIVGTLTVEELNLDRQKFQQAVQDAAKGDLATSGLQIDSFTIQAIRDESGYMELIGQQETARRERDARMAKAAADQEAAVREAEAEQVKINASRDVSLRRAETETQTAAAEARAAQAGPLAEAEATQEVMRKQTELADLEAARKEKELLTSTVRPAEADAAAQIRRAEGEKQSRIAAAQADAERVKLAGEAQARRRRGDRRGDRQADHARRQRRGRHRAVQGRGGGEGAGAPSRGVSPVQRGGHHPDRPVDAPGHRPRGRRADGQHRDPDRAVQRGRVGRRQERDPDRDRGLDDREGPDRHRHPGPAQQGARHERRRAAVRPRGGGGTTPPKPSSPPRGGASGGSTPPAGGTPPGTAQASGGRSGAATPGRSEGTARGAAAGGATASAPASETRTATLRDARGDRRRHGRCRSGICGRPQRVPRPRHGPTRPRDRPDRHAPPAGRPASTSPARRRSTRPPDGWPMTSAPCPASTASPTSSWPGSRRPARGRCARCGGSPRTRSGSASAS